MGFIDRLPEGAVWAVIILVVLTAIALRGYWAVRRHFGERERAEQRLDNIRTAGTPATATVLAAADTGVRRGADTFFLVALTLRVLPEDGVDSFDTSITVPLSPVRIPDFAEGRRIKVKVDPGTHDVAVDQRTQ
jgi:hypothetical protein